MEDNTRFLQQFLPTLLTNVIYCLLKLLLAVLRLFPFKIVSIHMYVEYFYTLNVVLCRNSFYFSKCIGILLVAGGDVDRHPHCGCGLRIRMRVRVRMRMRMRLRMRTADCGCGCGSSMN